MREAVERIRPDQIHLNTVVRPPAEGWVRALSREEMEEIRSVFGEKASVISEFDRHMETAGERNIQEEILRILMRRPLSWEDLCTSMKITEEELRREIEPLLRAGKIRARRFEDRQYYEIADCGFRNGD